MAGRRRGEIPGPLARGRERFEAWRRTRRVGARIPDRLWALAARLADVHGLRRTAGVLKLDYHSLKRRVELKGTDSTEVPVRFVEVSPASPTTASGECVIEFDNGSGASLRVHLRGCEVPDVVALGRSFLGVD